MMPICLNRHDYINNCISQLDTAISLISNETFDNSIYEEYLKKQNTSQHFQPNIDRIIFFLTKFA